MEGPVEKKSRTDKVENIAAVLYGVDDLRMVTMMLLLLAYINRSCDLAGRMGEANSKGWR